MNPNSPDPQEELRRRFDAWLAGELPPSDEAVLFAALAEDPALAAEARGARAVVASLRDLPPTMAPATDLWPAIASRTTRRTDAERIAQGRIGAGRSRRLRLFALAAALFLAVVAGAAWKALQVPAVLPADEAAGIGNGSPAGASASPLALAAYAETDLALGAIGDELRRAIEARQEKLPPETRALVFENLRTIDRALAEIEAALRESPADPSLARTYIAYRERQIDVLRQANRMAARL